MRILIIDDEEANAFYFTYLMRLEFPNHDFFNGLEVDSHDGYEGYIIDYRQAPENGDVIAARILDKNPAAKIAIFSNHDVDELRDFLPDSMRRLAVCKHPASTSGPRIMAILEQ